MFIKLSLIFLGANLGMCVIRMAILLRICRRLYNIKDFRGIDAALKQELVCGMHLIVHLLALILGCVLPAITYELGESWGFPESVDDVNTCSIFVLDGERFWLPHFKTQKLLTLSAISLSCISTHKGSRLWGVTIYKVTVSLDLKFLWYWRVKQQRRWYHFPWCFGGKSGRMISFLQLMFCAISMGGLRQCQLRSAIVIHTVNDFS